MQSVNLIDILRILQIFWLDLLLSGDNAVVIALASRSLSPSQRKLASALGSAAAIALRVILAFVLVSLLNLPYLRLLGGAFLLWIAVQLTLEGESVEAVRSGRSLWSAIRIIAFADALMSIDNVLAITAAARGSLWLIVFGLMLSLPLVVFGASLFVRLIHRFSWLIWLSAAMIGWSAGQMTLDDPIILQKWGEATLTTEILAGSAGALCVVVAGGLWFGLRRKRVKR